MVYTIILWICLFLIIVGFVSFSFIFIYKRLLHNKDYQTKSTFNYLKNNPIGSNLNSIEALVAHNSSLEPILKYLKAWNANYLTQLNVLKTQIQNNSRSIKDYALFSTAKSIKQVEENIQLLQQEQTSFKQFAWNTEEYTSYATKISISLLGLIGTLMNFVKEASINHHYTKNEGYKYLMKEIDFRKMEINKELNYINIPSIHRLFVKQALDIEKLRDLVYKMYDCEKNIAALNTIKMALDNIIKNENEAWLLPKEKIREVADLVHQVKFDIRDAYEMIETAEYAKANKMILSIVEKLELTKQEIETEKSFNEMCSKYSNHLQLCIKSFYNILMKNDIKAVYKTILQNFQHDTEVIDLTSNNINLVNDINNEIVSFENNLNNKQVTAIYLVNAICKISEKIVHFKNGNEELYRITKRKYGDFLELSFKISDLHIKLFHISKYAKKLGKSGDELLKRAKSYIKDVEEINAQFQDNFWGKTKELETKIHSIEDFIHISLESIKTDWTLIEINRRLKLYANRFYDKNKKQELDDIEKLVENKQYLDAAKQYLDFIEKYRKVRKSS